MALRPGEETEVVFIGTWLESPSGVACDATIDAVLARYIREADVYVVDVPGAELVVDGVDPRALMILDAPAPLASGESAWGTAESSQRKCRIFVYQRNVERAAGSVEHLEDELLHALEREITAVFLEKGGETKPDPRALN